MTEETDAAKPVQEVNACWHIQRGERPRHTTVDQVADPAQSRSELNTRTYLCAVCSMRIAQALTIVERGDVERVT